METSQKALAKIEDKLTDESLYDDTRKNDLTELLQQQGQVKSQLEETEEQWLEAQERLEDAKGK